MKSLKIFIVWLLFISNSYAQTTDWQQQYMNAKAHYKEEKYALAMESFKPLIQESPGNYFSTYSSFYYALAAYKSGYLPLAKDMLLQIKNKYPSWSKIDEVNYWLAVIFFENKNYNQGLNVLGSIKTKSFQDDIKALKFKTFKQINSIDEITAIYLVNENEEVLAKLLATKISDQPLVNQDRELLNGLIDKFNFNPKEFNLIRVEKSVFKEKYKVAVLMPFMADNLTPTDNKKVNQFVLDIYEGIRLAADTLKKEGVNIELFAYDTQRSSRVTKEIVSKEEMKGMDLIIGPLYSQCIEVVNEFSYKNKINVFNPLSSNSNVIGQNPFAFLFFPSNETVGRKSAEYVLKNVNNKPGVIIYEDNPTDSAIAYAYWERMKADSLKIIKIKKIRKDNSKEILDLLLISNTKLRDASSEEAKESYKIKLDSIGHIFVASSDDLISSKVLSAVETRGDLITVIGSANWLDLPVIKYSMYSKLGTVLYAPAYDIRSTLAYNTFRDRYVKKHKYVPSKYAEIGYEIMQLTGRALFNYGKYFQVNWMEKGFIEGNLTAGFNFTNSNDNLVVPMLTFDDEDVHLNIQK